MLFLGTVIKIQNIIKEINKMYLVIEPRRINPFEINKQNPSIGKKFLQNNGVCHSMVFYLNAACYKYCISWRFDGRKVSVIAHTWSLFMYFKWIDASWFNNKIHFI